MASLPRSGIRLIHVFLITVFYLRPGSSTNILFLFGGGNLSHKLSIWPLVTELADRSYNVTFVSSSAKQPEKNTKVHDLTPKVFSEGTESIYGVDRIQERKDGEEHMLWTRYEPGSLSLCNGMLNSEHDPALHNLIEHGNFDLIIVNSIFGECGLLLAHHFGSKYVIFDSSTIVPWFHGIYGIPVEASWVPDMKSQVTYPMGLLARMRVVYNYYLSYQRSASFQAQMIELYKKRFSLRSAPEFAAIERNASLVLVNSHYSIDFARSLPPMFVHIGGMQCWKPHGHLPKEYKEFMDGAREGVILISFGTTIDLSTISEFYLTIFFDTMRKFHQVRFIWKWGGTLPRNAPENLMASKWLPQREILSEKSVKGFMTHCGVNSINEATYHGVPLIAMPFFADQDIGAYRVQAQGIGVAVELRELSQAALDKAIDEIIHTQ